MRAVSAPFAIAALFAGVAFVSTAFLYLLPERYPYIEISTPSRCAPLASPPPPAFALRGRFKD